MKKSHESRVFCLNFVSRDPKKLELIHFFSRSLEDVRIECTREPQFERFHEVYILPVTTIHTINLEKTFRNDLFQTVIAYGPVAYLQLAFASGCTDYLKDPWTEDEMLIRSRKILERQNIRTMFGEFSLTPCSLHFKEKSVSLNEAEYRILFLLMKNKNSTVPRTLLFYVLWGKWEMKSRAVDMHIVSLRKKISLLENNLKGNKIIITERGRGYRLQDVWS